MDKYSVQIEAWAPFGEGRGNMFQNPVLNEIGKKYGKSAAQVILRWHLQRGVVVIPKSTHRERMAENFDLFGFHLTDGEMEQLQAMDLGRSQFIDHYAPNVAEMFVGAGSV